MLLNLLYTYFRITWLQNACIIFLTLWTIKNVYLSFHQTSNQRCSLLFNLSSCNRTELTFRYVVLHHFARTYFNFEKEPHPSVHGDLVLEVIVGNMSEQLYNLIVHFEAVGVIVLWDVHF